MDILGGIGLFLAAGAATCAVALLREWGRRRAVRRHPVKVSGEVTRLELAAAHEEGESSYIPWVAYTATDGVRRERALPARLEHEAPKVGAKIRLVHERGRPDNVLPEAPEKYEATSLWVGLAIAAAMGFLGFLIAFGRSSPEVPPAGPAGARGSAARTEAP